MPLAFNVRPALLDARALIADEAHYTPGSRSLDADGNEASSFSPTSAEFVGDPTKPAVRISMGGAILRATEDADPKLWGLVRSCLPSVLEGHSHARALAIFDEAIAAIDRKTREVAA